MSHYVAQTVLKLTAILLHLPLKSWDYRQILPGTVMTASHSSAPPRPQLPLWLPWCRSLSCPLPSPSRAPSLMINGISMTNPYSQNKPLPLHFSPGVFCHKGRKLTHHLSFRLWAPEGSLPLLWSVRGQESWEEAHSPPNQASALEQTSLHPALAQASQLHPESLAH